MTYNLRTTKNYIFPILLSEVFVNCQRLEVTWERRRPIEKMRKNLQKVILIWKPTFAKLTYKDRA